MHSKIKSSSERVLRIAAVFYTAIVLVLLLFPFFWLVSSALKDNIQIYEKPPNLLPSVPVRQEVYVDYSMISDAENIDDIIMQDAVKIIWGINYQFRTDNIQKIKVNILDDNTLLYSFSASNYKIWDAAREIMKTISYSPEMIANHYIAISDWMNIKEYNKEIDLKGRSGDDTAIIKDYLDETYHIAGEVITTQKVKDYSQYANNFISAWVNAGEFDTSVNKLGFGRFIVNSIFVSFMVILAQLSISSLAGYSLSKLVTGKLGKLILLFFLATMMIPFIATLLPMYIIFNDFGLLNTLWALILPSTSWGFAIYLFKGFFDKLPNDLRDAARIDGASEINTFVRIMVPLSKPVFGVISLWSFLAVWNEFMWANITIQKPALWTYTVALYKIQQGSGSFAPNESMALNVIAIVPTLFIMLIFQKSIQKGIALTGIKG
jgi:ABC-type glycerol-3-phosphate transport system permease component